LPRLKLEYKKQDCWLGVYWDKEFVWVCLIPCFPIKITRQTVCKDCGKPIKGRYGGFPYHDQEKTIKFSEYSDELVTCWENKKINDQVDEDCS
jgi:hypothetical protein